MSSSQLADAYAALDAFEQSPHPGCWPHLDKATLIAEMRSRLKNPFIINQRQQPFCGPASILFELARKQPLRYVTMGQALYEQGTFQAKTEAVCATENLCRASRDPLHMAQADWMMLAALREAETLIFPVEPNAPTLIRNLAGMTKSWEMVGWVKEVLGYPQASYYHAYLFRDMKALKRAESAIQRGGVAFALVTAGGMLGSVAQKTRLALPNHWVTLLSTAPVDVTPRWQDMLSPGQGAALELEYYTWGDRRSVTIQRSAFRRFFWGFVIGEP
ncbi:MAG: hypothetical protein WBA10_14605 [Elainellaceae cyanobacterium]